MMIKLKTWFNVGYEWDVLIEYTMNKTSGYKLTIIVPAYNELGNIYRLEEKLTTFVAQPSGKLLDYPS